MADGADKSRLAQLRSLYNFPPDFAPPLTILGSPGEWAAHEKAAAAAAAALLLDTITLIEETVGRTQALAAWGETARRLAKRPGRKPGKPQFGNAQELLAHYDAEFEAEPAFERIPRQLAARLHARQRGVFTHGDEDALEKRIRALVAERDEQIAEVLARPIPSLLGDSWIKTLLPGYYRRVARRGN